MTLEQLIEACRLRSDDFANAHQLWSDEEWTSYLNQAEDEAAIRARLIEDETSQATQVQVTTAERRYKLHHSIEDVISITAALHHDDPVVGWEATRTELVFDELPREDDTLTLRVIRRPLRPMDSPGDSPEIPAHMHHRLVDWAMRCAYLKKDSEVYDPAESAKHEAEFERYFGRRHSANVRRKHRRNSARVVRPIQF